ncbi:hypothetical protein POM88_001419 [Heracleum sosnowskyi]|uniref:Uncharacterized protein n=1 Tax=Heracleum sosnowskyi TaxID=360622 RepID=A0AAD8JCG8_9APIA|nr:hypothetical protein POM88_001417 [Heracleum sosnowskyi]KAK1401814.1 hypothetical protein POM88_001419 [Heracleum sosnowskyi]
MASAQKFLVLALAALLICSTMIRTTEAQENRIDYSRLRKASRPKQDLPKPGPGQANAYNRGKLISHTFMPFIPVYKLLETKGSQGAFMVRLPFFPGVLLKEFIQPTKLDRRNEVVLPRKNIMDTAGRPPPCSEEFVPVYLPHLALRILILDQNRDTGMQGKLQLVLPSSGIDPPLKLLVSY